MKPIKKSQEPPCLPGVAGDDYVRMVIPRGTLRSLGRARVPLRALARERAVLLLFLSADAADSDLQAGELQEIPLIRLIPVVPAARLNRSKPSRQSGLETLTDPKSSAARSLGVTRLPAAVLLGADGMLAGGPVCGRDAILDMVETIRAQVGEAFPSEIPGSSPPTSTLTMTTPRTAEALAESRYLPISCKCITYGRVEYLEEALQSFLFQDYGGEHELVIVNDYPLQRLHFDHPRVRIINLDFTFRTIGEKENFAVSACRFDTIAVWDDDDLAMPNHLENINRYFPGHRLLHWQRGVALVGGKVTSLGSLGNSGIVYSKEAWSEVGGHAFENAGYDVTFVNKLLDAGVPVALADPQPRDASWFYSWGNGSYHMSGLGTDDDSRPDVVTRHARHIEELRSRGLIPTGDVELKPHWKRDYPRLLTDYCDHQGL